MLRPLMNTKFILATKPAGPLAVAPIDRTVQLGQAVLPPVTFEVGLAFEGFGPVAAWMGTYIPNGVVGPSRCGRKVAADTGKRVNPVRRLVGYPGQCCCGPRLVIIPLAEPREPREPCIVMEGIGQR
jgi:hypothetical protein